MQPTKIPQIDSTGFPATDVAGKHGKTSHRYRSNSLALTFARQITQRERNNHASHSADSDSKTFTKKQIMDAKSNFPGKKFVFDNDIPKKAMSISQQSVLPEGESERGQLLKGKRGMAIVGHKLRPRPTLLTFKFSGTSDRVANEAAQRCYVEKTYKLIEESVASILDHSPIASYHEIYSAGESIYRFGPSHCEKLWLSLETIIQSHIDKQLHPLVQKGKYIEPTYYSKASIEFGEQLVTVCARIQTSLRLLEKLFCYLDQGFLQTSSRYHSVFSTGISCLVTEFDLIDYVIFTACASIGFEALSNKTEHYETFNGLFNLTKLVSPDTFSHIPYMMLYRYQDYVVGKSFKAMSIRELLETIISHHDNFSSLLNIGVEVETHLTNRKLPARMAETALLAREEKVRKGVAEMIQNDDTDTAALLAKIINWSEKPCFSALYFSVEDEVRAILTSDYSEEPQGLIKRLIAYRRRLSNFVRTQSDGSQSYLKKNINETWSSTILANKEYDEMVVLDLVKHIDKLMKSKDQDSLVSDLSHALDLLPTIEDKGMLLHYYQLDLARRLIGGKTNQEMENIVIEGFKKECGSTFVQDLETMSADIELSKDLSKKFQESSIKKQGFNVSFKVLTDTRWPKSRMLSTAKLPRSMQEMRDKFAEFYGGMHAKRKLMWDVSKDLVVVRGIFDEKPRELYANIFQALIILLFNDADELSYAQIVEGTGIAKDDLNPALHSLVMGRIHILSITRETTADLDSTRRGKVEDYELTDRFRIVDKIRTKSGIANSHKLILTGYKVASRVRDERTLVREQIKQSRNLELQAAIVRVMKMQRRIKHIELFQRVAELTANRGVMTMSDFKKALDELMAPGNPYVVRDEEDSSVYLYSV